ncbi:hypothetical protein JMJ55_00945 [Belnapia sp. T6]|uniref:Uncharacterized protein n=1 Tax=Belnapia mucosa TaxID=2804532 RepID=A0ABS1UX22_9PROT|nr:hypothetical protein [Belnapia mucosa]MBL6453867.1 hypothetical protein [Belnapia mucosa]
MTSAARLAILGALLLPGCARFGGSEVASTPAAMPVAAALPPSDPMVAFAATARPGAETMVGGARVRLLRAYHAASGRDCRELLVGSGMGERSRLVCEAEGQWAEARPLLGSGGMQRP